MTAPRLLLVTLSLFCSGVCFAQRAGEGADLKYALIVTRHGVRTPTWTLERLNQYSASPWPSWGVPPGHLTGHGRALMKIMGGFYREYFSARNLPGGLGCAGRGLPYFWADTNQRTLETARALAETMAPGCKAEIHSAPAGTTDSLFDPIEAGTATQDVKLGIAAVTGRIGPSLDAVVEAHRPAFDELTRVLNGKGRAARSIFDEPIALVPGKTAVEMAGPLRLASTLSENLLLEYANGMSGAELGWGRLNAVNLLQIMSLHTAYADLMRRTPYLARVRGSNLLNRVLRSLEQAATGRPVPLALGPPDTALVVISGHDTNLSNLSGMLGLSWVLPSYQPDDIPPGGAMIFTLWRSSSGGRYSVQVQFVAQTLDQMHRALPLSFTNPPAIADVFLPGCSTSQDGFGCEWSSFQRTVLAAIGTAAAH